MLPTVDGSSVQNVSSASSPCDRHHAAVSPRSFSHVIARCPALFLSNVRSIFSKMDELRLSVSCLQSDIVFITESWLNSDIADDLLYMNHFDLFRCDRVVRKGGGVCIWAKSDYKPEILVPVSSAPATIEVCFIRIFCKSFFIVCVGIYVPPGLCKDIHVDITDFLTNEFDHILDIYPDDKFIVAGDFNDFRTNFLGDYFCLVNRVTEPTRSGAFLDQIWIDEGLCDFYPKSAAVGPPLKTSDHCCVVLRPLCAERSTENRRPTLVWDFRKSNLLEFLRRLSVTDFNDRMTASSVDGLCDQFYDALSWCLSAIPCESVFFSSCDKPWMTPILKLLIDKRWAAFRNKNWASFAHYKAKVKCEIQKAKKLWYAKQSTSSRGLWNVVRSTRGPRVRDPWQRLVEQHGSVQSLLNKLTDTFSSNFNTDDDVSLLPLSNSDWAFSISVESVFHLLSKLNSRKAAGPDQIPPLLLKIGASFLCGPIANIFNVSIKNRTFPSFFKHALVCPVPKKSSPTLCDFRPISLLSPLAKLFERLVLNHVKHDLFSCYGSTQHAYRPLGSTTTALVELHDYVTMALDRKQTVGVNIFCLDLSKAFDKLQHHRLLNYLSNCGLNHGFLRWLCSYLSSRSMSVKVLNNFGPVVSVPSGVPQGSVLGPFLFAAFMGSINFSVENVKCIKYADDLTIIEPLSLNQPSCITLSALESLFEDCGLVLNRSKCKLLYVRRSVDSTDFLDSGFTPVSSLKILGVIVTDRLKWDLQISTLLKTASQRLYIIRCLKDFVATDELVLVYHAIITSVFLYASPSYGRLPSTLLTRLERFQRRAHRLICGATCSCNRFPPLVSRLEGAARKLLLLAESNAQHPLHELVPGRLPASGRFRMPVCLTSRRLNSFFPWSASIHNASFTS